MVLVRLVPLRTQRSLNKRGSIGGHGAGLTTYAADPVQDEEALREWQHRSAFAIFKLALSMRLLPPAARKGRC